MNTKAVLSAIQNLETDRGISKEVIVEVLIEALEKAYRKNFDPEIQADILVRAEVDEKTGNIKLYNLKNIVDDVEDEVNEISLEDARKRDKSYDIGDVYETEVKTDEFGRLAAVQAKQILRQKIREAEKQIVFEEFADRKDDIITGVIDRVEPKYVIINLGKTGAILPLPQQIPGERYREGDHIKVYVVDVDKTSKGAQVIVSRSEPNLVKRLFELEVPEIFDGTVEIKSIAREPGDRCKMAVYAKDKDVDAIGSCIGPKGQRVLNVVEELNNEKIDIIEWSEDPVVYLSNALSPSVVSSVMIKQEGNKDAIVIVPDNQLSLAIGKRGQNARLAARLTGWKIDIKSESDASAMGIEYILNVNPKYHESAKIEEEIIFEVEDFVEPDNNEVELEKIDEVKEAIVEEESDVKVTTEEVVENTPVVEEKIQVEVQEEVQEEALPIYTEAEIAMIEAEDEEDFEDDDDDIDYDEYDKYYDN